MKDIFKEDNKKQFMRLFKIFTDSITEKWPDCQDTKDYKLLFDNVVMHDENKQTELLDAWYANLTIALSRKVKYTKALVYYKEKNYQKAIQFFQEADKLIANDGPTLFFLNKLKKDLLISNF